MSKTFTKKTDCVGYFCLTLNDNKTMPQQLLIHSRGTLADKLLGLIIDQECLPEQSETYIMGYTYKLEGVFTKIDTTIPTIGTIPIISHGAEISNYGKIEEIREIHLNSPQTQSYHRTHPKPL